MALTVAQLVARVTADTSGFYRGMAIANSSMIRTGSIIGRVAAGAGLATVGMGIMSLRAAGNFEQSMNILQAVAEPTKKQFENLRDEAIALGADLKLPNVSAKDAAEAMQELAKGGLNVDQILSSTRGTLQLGLAANMGFADSATIVARALKAFSLDGSKATTIADLFAAAANKSTADMTDLALGFQMASAQFAAGDQSINTLTASLGLMANAGIIGSDAGTSLKTMMNRLMAPTKKAKDLMDDLGFSVYDSSGNMKAMPNLIGDLGQSLQGMSKEQRNATLYTIFGSDAIRASRVLLKAGEKGIRDFTEEISKGGDAQRLAEARTKGFNGAMQAFGSAAETLAIVLGTALLPAATAAVKGMTQFLMAIDPDKIIGFFAAIADGVKWFYNLVAGSDAAQYALVALAGAFAGLLIMNQIVSMIKSIQVAWIAMNATFAASPLGLIIIAIAGLVAALVLAYTKVEWFRNAVDSAFNWLKTNIPPIMQSIVNFIRDAWDDIKAVFQVALKVIQTWWNLTWGQVLNFIIKNWDAIQAVIQSALNIIMNNIRGVLTTIKGVVNVIMGIIRGDWGRAWQGIKQIVDGILGTIVRNIKEVLSNLVPAVLNLALRIGKAIINGILNALSSLAQSVFDKLQSGISSAIDYVIGGARSAAARIGEAIVDGILGAFTSLPGKIADKLGGAIGSGLDKVNVFGWSTPAHAGQEFGKIIGDNIILGWLAGVKDLPEKISESLREALEAGKRVVEQLTGEIASLFSTMTSDIERAFDAATANFKTKSEKLLEAFDLKKAKEEAAKKIKDLKDELAAAQGEASMLAEPELVRGTDETEEEFRERAAREWEAYREEMRVQRGKVAEAQAALDAEINAQAEERERARLVAAAERERLEYEARRERQKRRLLAELQQLEEYLKKHPEKHKEIQGKIMRLLKSYEVDYFRAGKNLGEAFAHGMAETAEKIEAAAKKLAEAVRGLLELKSPADKGPLSTLDKWWEPFGDTLLQGLGTSGVEQAIAGMVRKPTLGVAGSYVGSQRAAYMGAGASGGGVTINMPGATILGRDRAALRELADMLVPMIETQVVLQ